uniref:Mediator of RNA polymerase II transcription subunit 9 n=1 Tax=Rhizophora mucronata TaxID=61149 RepID=A0A2P2JWM3_RHIMU
MAEWGKTVDTYVVVLIFPWSYRIFFCPLNVFWLRLLVPLGSLNSCFICNHTIGLRELPRI